MDYNEIVSATKVALSDVLGHPVDLMTEDSRLIEDLHLDSTTGMELLMAMEESVGLVVDPDGLDMDDFKTVGTFASYVARQTGAAAGEQCP
jgi:acyl carrier protein